MRETWSAVPIGEFVESMLSWAAPMAARRSRWRGDHPVLSSEDMLQEAKLALVEVWNKYAGNVPEIEMRRMGTRAVHFHLGNIWHSTEAKSRKAVTVSLDREPENHPSLGEQSIPGKKYPATVVQPAALDRLVVRDEIERLKLSAEERTLFAETMAVADGKVAGALPAAAALKIFRRRLRGKKASKTFGSLSHKIRGVLRGYKKPGGAGIHNDGGRGRKEKKNMDINVGIVSPDLPAVLPQVTPCTYEVAEQPKAPKAPKAPKTQKAPKAKKQIKIERTGAMSASDTKKTSAAFKKGAHVTYKGGGRAPWLKTGTTLLVKGTVVSRGRTYVRCFAVNAKKPVSLSSALLAPSKETVAAK